MGELEWQAQAEKDAQRTAPGSERSTGTVISIVDATHAKVDLGDKTVTALVPPSMAGIVAQAQVLVRVSNVSVIEAVLSAPSDQVQPLPGGRVMVMGTVSITPDTAGVYKEVTWTYPVAFAAPPVMVSTQARTSSSNVDNTGFNNVTATSMSVGLLRNGTPAATEIWCWAIGTPA